MSDPYRGETEMLRQRVTELEDELATARTRIATLEGEPTSSGFGKKLIGGETLIEFERTVDGELPTTMHEELHELVTRSLGSLGQASTVGRSFTYNLTNQQSARYVEISVRPIDGKTVVRVRERLNGLAGGLFGGIVGGLGGGGLGGVVPAALVLGLGVLTPVVCVAWLASVWLIVRTAFGSISRKRRRAMDALASDLEKACTTALQKARVEPAAAVRVAHAPTDDAAAEAEAEAEADDAVERAGAGRR